MDTRDQAVHSLFDQILDTTSYRTNRTGAMELWGLYPKTTDANAAANITMDLQNAAANFMEAYKNADEAMITDAAGKLEGELLLQVTTDKMSDKYARVLIDQLQDIVENKKWHYQ